MNINAVDAARKLALTLTIFRRKIFSGLKFPQENISHTQIMIISMLMNDGVQSMTFFHEHTGLEKGSLTSVIDSLVEKGHVKRINDPNDRRKVLVELTPHGKKIAVKLEENLVNYISEKFQVIPNKDLAELITSINKINSIMEKL